MKSTVLAIAFLTCVLLSVNEGVPFIHPHCRCSSTQVKEIKIERIQKMVAIAPGLHCKNLQVIATVKFKKEFETCVNPSDKWVQEAMKKFGLMKSNSTETNFKS